jgi:hypothetical protein
MKALFAPTTSAWSSKASWAGSALSGLLRLTHVALEQRQPLGLVLSDHVVHGAPAAGHLDRRGREEAAAREHLSLDVGEKRVAERDQPARPARGGQGGADHLIEENLPRALDGRELELLLGPEVRVEARVRLPLLMSRSGITNRTTVLFYRARKSTTVLFMTRRSECRT